MHLDGCVEVEAAYYGAPPGWIGQRVQVQWNDLHVRLLAPTTGQLLREHLRAPRGWHRIARRRPPGADAGDDASRCSRAAPTRRRRTSAPSAHHIHDHEGAAGVRRILGVLALAKKHGPAVVDDAAKAALELGVPTYRFLRRYLERRPPVPLTLTPSRSAHPPAHPLPRSHRSQDRRPDMNLVELDRALRKLRLSGMADVLETRLRHAQTEKTDAASISSSALVGDELLRRQDRLARAPAQTGALPRPRPLARHALISISTRR